MTEEHLACPQCGYDLYGIPERRCPECGFGFDFAALKNLAADSELLRWAAARALLLWTSPAAALAMPAAARALFSARWHLALPVAATLGAMVIWIRLIHAQSRPSMILGMIAGAVVILGFLTVPTASLMLAAPLLLKSWSLFLTEWPDLPPLQNSRRPLLWRAGRRWSIAAMTGLLFTSAVAVIGCFG